MEKKRIAIVRIRGTIKAKKEVVSTLRMLRLFKKNGCVVIKNDPSYTGMLERVKDYVTWGEINEETFKTLLMERGKLAGNKKLTEVYLKDKVKLGFDEFSKEFFMFKKELKEVPGLKLFFKLSPPRKGFERGGIKKPYSMGGVLGYRKDKINDLIKRMI